MDICNVTAADAKELLAIYSVYVKDTAISFEYTVPTVEEFTERIKTISARYPYIKAVENGEILGYAYAGTFKDRAAYDWSVETTIYVKQDARRKGVGEQLYTALERALCEMGIKNMNACIASTEQEDEHLTNDSYYFHKKMGFELVGTFHQSGYKFDRWYDMIWMEKLIGTHDVPAEKVAFPNEGKPAKA